MAAFGYSNQSKIFREILLQNSNDYMLHDSVFVDMKVFALQLKEKSTACVSDEILRNFRTATFEVNFEGYF